MVSAKVASMSKVAVFSGFTVFMLAHMSLLIFPNPFRCLLAVGINAIEWI